MGCDEDPIFGLERGWLYGDDNGTSSDSNDYLLNEGFEGSMSRWQTAGTYPWSITDQVARNGSYSAFAYPIGTSYTYLTTTVSTPMYGTVEVSFYFKVDCEHFSSAVSEFTFAVGSSQIYKRTGNSKSWDQVSRTINLNAIATPIEIYFYAQTTAGSGNCSYYLDDVKVY